MTSQFCIFCSAFIAILSVSIVLGQHETIKQQCLIPHPPNNGYITTDYRQFVDIGTTIVFECNNGYQLHGSSTIVCGPNGSWNIKIPICVKIISPIIPMCRTLPNPNNGAVSQTGVSVGSTAQYSCNEGFTLQRGNAVRTCSRKGRWSGRAPFCRKSAVNCPELANPVNGSVKVNGLIAGSKARYSCNDGFRVNARMNKVRRCRFNGQWSGNDPVCIRIPTCPNLTNPENGNIHLTRGVTAGSKARYSCNAGFKVTGNRARRCQPNGQWTGKDPICEKRIVKTCSELYSPKYGNVHVTGVTRGSTATYSCEPGFILKRGRRLRKCRARGHWSGRQPVCVSQTKH